MNQIGARLKGKSSSLKPGFLTSYKPLDFDAVFDRGENISLLIVLVVVLPTTTCGYYKTRRATEILTRFWRKDIADFQYNS